ncbi:uncharacterized protein LOC106160035 [Lingula anatina]|uniref:Uncharacterized protein LOC106160035 n=1 Tax=Lingula anatina TaxID=7574 RepID=A0A1S3I145_LINAN|nr:uncharacterized protein LOC106160035 [Lingula anatina]|eukprot:XP_013391983.1 uncharacterized protein LOC106160035 [Lingula anatina]
MAEEESEDYQIKQPHVSILRSDESPRLTGCTDWSCGCHKHHCPMCTLEHFKPSNKTQTLKHLSWHFRHSYKYKGLIICECKLDCPGTGKTFKRGHFHCPECGDTMASKPQIVNHIAVLHEGKAPPEKEGRRILVSQLGAMSRKRKYLAVDEEFVPRKSSRTRKTIDYNALAEDGIKKIRKGISTEAEQEEAKEVVEEEKEEEKEHVDETADTKIAALAKGTVTSVKHPHISLVSGQQDLVRLSICDPEFCDCGGRHCPLCPVAAFQPTVNMEEFSTHISGHMDNSVPYKDKKLVSCQLGDIYPNPSEKASLHWHCPECAATCLERDLFIDHLLGHLEPAHLDGSVEVPSGGENDEADEPSDDKSAELKKGSLLHIAFPHKSIVKSVDELVASCEDDTCMLLPSGEHARCNLLHCAVCPNEHFKPVKYKAALLKHLQWHIKFALWYKDAYLVVCKQGCSSHKSVAHFHCPHCGQTVVKKKNLVAHMLVHCDLPVTSDLSKVTEHPQDDKLPENSHLPDEEDEEEEPPSMEYSTVQTLDNTVQSLAADRGQDGSDQGGKAVIEATSEGAGPNIQTGHDAISHPHISLVTDVDDMLRQCHRCNKRACPSCHGKLFHCPVCPAKVKLHSALVTHIESHVAAAVTFRGIKICLCKLKSCLPKLKTKSVGHYHCPLCGSIQAKGVRLRAHLKAHKLGTVRTRDSVAGVPRKSRQHLETTPQQRETLDSFPVQNPATIASAYDLLTERCKRTQCHCRGFHCPLCPVKYFKPPQSASHLLNHGENHINHSVPYKGVYLTLCRMKCKQGTTTSHYHCPECGDLFRRRHLVVDHMKIHDPTFSYKPPVPASSATSKEKESTNKPEEEKDAPLTEADIFVSVTAIVSNKLFAAVGMDQKEVLQTLTAETGILCAIMEDGQNVIQGSWEAMNKATEKLKVMAGLTVETEAPVEKPADEPDSDSGDESDLDDLNGEGDDPDYDPIDDSSSKTNRRYLCGLCSYETGEVADMHKHVRSEHEDAYKCLFCGRIGTSEYDLKRHLQTIHQDHPEFDIKKSAEEPPGSMQCPRCTFTTNVDKILFYHTLLDHYEKGKTVTRHYQCTQCQYSSNNIGNLRAHIGRKHPTEKHLCNICGKEFGFDSDLKEHISVVHQKDNCCVCDLCGKEFASRRYLQAHLKRHLGIKNHACPICGKRFMEKVRMREHMETHQDASVRVLKYECDICGKRFANAFYVRDHKNIHTGEKPHVCPHCGQAYALRLTLRNHLLTHQNDKPFKCEVCPKAFKTKVKLNYHMVTHTGIGKHDCSVCHKVFTQKSTLRRHRCPGYPMKKRMAVRGTEQIGNSQDVIQVHVENHQEGAVTLGQGDQQLLIMDGTEGSEVKEQELYMCSICNNIFMNWNEMESHMQEHIGEGQGQGQSQGQIVGEAVGAPMAGNSTDVVSSESIEMAIALAELPGSV